jgi:hypothetical protein
VEVAAVSEQIGLFDAPKRKPRHRRSDPLSSMVAAERSVAFLAEHAIAALKMILDAPGLTAKQLAALPKATLTYHQLSRRTGELAEGGWIVRTPCPVSHELRMIATSKASAYFGCPNPASGSWQEHPGPGEKIRDARLT